MRKPDAHARYLSALTTLTQDMPRFDRATLRLVKRHLLDRRDCAACEREAADEHFTPEERAFAAAYRDYITAVYPVLHPEDRGIRLGKAEQITPLATIALCLEGKRLQARRQEADREDAWMMAEVWAAEESRTSKKN